MTAVNEAKRTEDSKQKVMQLKPLLIGFDDELVTPSRYFIAEVDLRVLNKREAFGTWRSIGRRIR